MIDQSLKRWATPKQQQIIDAVNHEGSYGKAARFLNCDSSLVSRQLASVRKKAALAGYSPEHDYTHPVPDGFKLKGASLYYPPTEDSPGGWFKSEIDKDKQEEIIRATVLAFTEEITPKKPVKSPKVANSDLLTAYCIGDAHIGMYAWGEETGEDFDCRIAASDLFYAAQRLVESTPQSKECLIAQLGDFYHLDDSTNVTPGQKNKLDVDTRYRKVIRTGIEIMKRIIDTALLKHKVVRVRNVAGNHDPHAYVALDEGLIGYYSKEPRVIIESTPKPIFIYRFYNNLIGITHGHAPKPDKLPGNLAVYSAKDWGECEYKYIWHGHIHNKRIFEDMGCLVESFRTLAPKDAWTNEQGYICGREMQAIVLHRSYGEIERHTAGIKQVRETGQNRQA